MGEHIDTSTTQHARRRRQGQRLTKQEREQAQATFLDALGKSANVTAACLMAGIHRSVVYQWQEHDTEFSIEFQEANKRANDLLFAEAWQRAMKGEERYVVSRGELVYKKVPDGKGGMKNGEPVTYREKSDRMLELLLKARLPEFREKQQIALTGKDGGPIRLDLSGLSDDELAVLDMLAEKVRHGTNE